MKAYKNYKKGLNSEFTSYAYMYIYGEILKTIKENRNIKISDDYYKVYKAYEKTKDFLTNKLNREPSLDEIGEFMNIDSSYLNDVIVTLWKPNSEITEMRYPKNIDPLLPKNILAG